MEKLVALGNSVWQLFLTLPPITQWAVAMLTRATRKAPREFVARFAGYREESVATCGANDLRSEAESGRHDKGTARHRRIASVFRR